MCKEKVDDVTHKYNINIIINYNGYDNTNYHYFTIIKQARRQLLLNSVHVIMYLISIIFSWSYGVCLWEMCTLGECLYILYIVLEWI